MHCERQLEGRGIRGKGDFLPCDKSIGIRLRKNRQEIRAI
jgi:hypothetical protein